MVMRCHEPNRCSFVHSRDDDDDRNADIQAEAHYKGHKHARKMKALETQRKRQKNGHSSTTTGRDRGRERRTMGRGTVPMDSHLKDIKGLRTSSQPAQQQPESIQESLPEPTPPSKPPSTDSSSLRSPQLSPLISPGPQLNDLPSDGPPVDGCGPANGSTPLSDPQGSPTAGEEEEEVKVEEAKEAKTDTKTLHCPTCKVTVNSSSQLESHCSGMF
ncbi:hypothetical protein EYF80_035402 [Liparis tanakae]|uniref:C2H2-type domain-containing protein n=1 Tax=Liparis tanakae TaxID=230148 RepID=A0A4Z2GNQ9_9TELE|nr:hypothetical protein EYF80_035402 [Liparis tanakae]